MKFTWEKKGLIFDASSLNLNWAKNSALTPTPLRISDDVIRIYAGFRDEFGVSRIGFVDVSVTNPTQILRVSQKPCLDIGRDGCFDDNGVILGDVIWVNSIIYMYYVGFQIVNKVKFLAFSGLATSSDGGETFQRIQEHPILDRCNAANMINAIHSVLPLPTGGYRVWHAKGDGWQTIDGKKYPKYNIWSSTSKNGFVISNDAVLCVDTIEPEYRIGRPSIYLIGDSYIMFYTKGSTSGVDYYPGIALSDDGVRWTRRDDLFGIDLSYAGWDSKHIAYPRLIKIKDNRYYVFYNGNNMGQDGFGYAELEIEI